MFDDGGQERSWQPFFGRGQRLSDGEEVALAGESPASGSADIRHPDRLPTETALGRHSEEESTAYQLEPWEEQGLNSVEQCKVQAMSWICQVQPHKYTECLLNDADQIVTEVTLWLSKLACEPPRPLLECELVWIKHIEMDCDRIEKSISNFLPHPEIPECDDDDDDNQSEGEHSWEPEIEKQDTTEMIEKQVTTETIDSDDRAQTISDDDQPLSGGNKGKGKNSKAKNAKASTDKKKAKGKGNNKGKDQGKSTSSTPKWKTAALKRRRLKSPP